MPSCVLLVCMSRSEEHTLYITSDASASIELTVDGQVLMGFNTVPAIKSPKQTIKVSVLSSFLLIYAMSQRT
jgi:hypothetical protein